MDKESMLQAAEDEWLHAYHLNERGYYWPEDELAMPWFWLILAESIWPTPIVEDAIDDFSKWLITGE